ncbi:glutathione S-transferase 1-like [Arachis hypogaea]|uniref:glutathione S-transferase 1-like n=1 Tax=Arachis hypogaea TaxID=3818 RepID=UPI003B224EEA
MELGNGGNLGVKQGLKYHYVAVTASSKSDPEFLKLNPLALIPVLVDGDFVLVESLAIIMYLDDNYPQYPSLPHDIPKRALNFQNNVIEKNVGPHEKLPWAQSVIRKGFTGDTSLNAIKIYSALEKLLKDHAGRYATGDEIFLVVEELMKRCEETKW